MKVLELFAGTQSIGKAFKKRGHQVFSIDWDEQFDVDLHMDISQLTADLVLEKFGHPDVIWASPDCTTYSIARIWTYRKKNPSTGELEPIHEYAKFCDDLNRHLLKLIEELKPTYWFIENPRGGLRTMSFMQGLPRYTVTYCKYGDFRQKPTDIWTNHPNPCFKPPCGPGDKCHSAAPRGSTFRKMKRLGYSTEHIAGTQYIYGKNAKRDRAIIPPLLCEHIVDICEGIEEDEQMNIFEFL